MSVSSIEFIRFPSVTNTTDDGLLAMGGELTRDTLVSAYSQGIFPWFNEDQPVLWWSPDPRMVLFPSEIKISRSLKKLIRQKKFNVSCNEAFEEVISACALRGVQAPLVTHEETWITEGMKQAYTELHAQHYAHSIEVWNGNELVGGLYGVALGDVFFGESMFSRESNASKVALVTLCQNLHQNGFSIIDCQVASDHLFSLGAREIPRLEFLGHLKNIDYQQAKPNFSKGFKQASAEFDIT